MTFVNFLKILQVTEYNTLNKVHTYDFWQHHIVLSYLVIHLARNCEYHDEEFFLE